MNGIELSFSRDQRIIHFFILSASQNLRMKRILTILFLATFVAQGITQEKSESLISEKSLSALEWRNIGPAFASGRIADIAIHPDHEHTWYVAVGSGGVWKTVNSGVTWKPIFDDQKSYSTGCITIDPSNHHRVWLGTGENVGGRHVAFGDGVYLSEDDGGSWKNMGLTGTQHISKIIVQPDNSDVVWVAAQGPLWNKGGERGLYMTKDGGKSWIRTLGDDEWTGVTDIAIDPRNSQVLYAATWQRHRTVAAYMGGGPLSGIHKSVDGGQTWVKLSKGLPNGNMGKIGLAISPQNPDVIYAAIETDRTQGGLYKSVNRGASWEKQSDAVSGATGPHYYQELYASPHQYDKLYLMDVRIQVSEDGGKTFSVMQERDKHSDNHAIAFKKSDPNYLLIGTDAGIYESFDGTENWRFIDNLPLTQYYKVAVDDQLPFYYVYGGTQDNGSHSGPSRTDEYDGIRNAHWYKTLGADGHQSATTPGNPNIFYAETQQGGMHRIDRLTGEQILIQPQSGEDEDPERFNWDAPIVVSSYDPARLYFASQRVWRSDDRGDSWKAISGDLSKGQGDRMKMPIMGRQQSWDSPWDMKAMSNYNSITSLAESPLAEGLIYAGTDDGLVQITENGGSTWRKVEVSQMPGVSATAFVNDIKADLFDANTVYVALDNHKYGDFKPYLMKSSNRGKTWQSISSGLSEGTLVWRTIQDHVKPELMFAATETGVYVSFEGGGNWMKLKGGLPTISFRGITIQRRENDLVAASFGRGFFILDDYSALRQMNNTTIAKSAHVYPVKDALLYSQRSLVGDQGASMYAAKNPDYGAIITYHITDDFESLASKRKSAEKDLNKKNMDVSFAGWEALMAEKDEIVPLIWLTIKDSEGNVVNKIEEKYKKGIHRTAWDLTYASERGISLNSRGGAGGGRWNRGYPVVPGDYSVTLSKEDNGEITQLDGPVAFKVVPLRDGALPAQDADMIADYRKELDQMRSAISAINYTMDHTKSQLSAMRTAANRTKGDVGSVLMNIKSAQEMLKILDLELNGNPLKEEVGEMGHSTLQSRLGVASRGGSSTYGPTKTQRDNLEIAKKEFQNIKLRLEELTNGAVKNISDQLQAKGAPYVDGQAIPDIGN